MGPLDGIKVVELAGTAPAPFACMMLSDLGAEVLRVDRPDVVGRPDPSLGLDPLQRNRRSVAVDLKSPAGAAVVRRLVERADVLVEGFRPGVMERLGLGPDELLAANPGLVYGRMTGWGQDGPLAPRAGHDINYIAVAGALEPIGRSGERPLAPLNLVGDFGGGGMLLALGVLAALVERSRSGLGQVVDAAMVDGASLLMSFVHGLHAQELWSAERGTNLLDGGAPYYDTYETADGKYVAVGALERRFYRELLRGLGLEDDPDLPAQNDRARWPELRARFTTAFKSRTRDEWAAIFSGLDACVAPVYSPVEAVASDHAQARESFVEVGGVAQPAPAPRFGRTPARRPAPGPAAGEHSVAALWDWGFDGSEIRSLLDSGVVACTDEPGDRA